MTQRQTELGKPGRLFTALVYGVGAWFAMSYTGPIMQAGRVNELAALAAFFFFVSVIIAVAELFHLLGDLFDWLRANQTTGLKGTAGFVRSLRELKKDLIHKGWGPYWGTFKGKEIIADFASNALLLGPAGTGKGVGILIQTILAIRESKVVIDFKGEFACMLARLLRRMGQEVIILNIGDMWPDILGPSAHYNPQTNIADNFSRSGGLLDLSDDLREKTLQLYPEPEGGTGKDDNRYFQEGSRTFISFAELTSVLIKGQKATEGDVQQLLANRQSLLRHAQWAAGRLDQEGTGVPAVMPLEDSPWVSVHPPEDVANFIAHYRTLASGVADLLESEDSRTADAFLTGAQQALARYNATTRAHKVTSRTTFRFADLKEGKPKTVFIVADASRMNAQKDVLGLLQWCMFTELKRHENKHRPVYLIADEATNFKLHDLGSLLTWGRGYGIRMLLVLQSFSAFRRVYGEDTLKTLLSETETKIFLAGQREPETLKMIEDLLGQQSIIVRSRRGDRRHGGVGIDGEDYREEGRPLMTADEIRRTKKSILILRQNKPVLTDLPPIAAIAPWRKQIDINPFHGKPFLRPVTLRLKRRSGSMLKRFVRLFKSEGD